MAYWHLLEPLVLPQYIEIFYIIYHHSLCHDMNVYHDIRHLEYKHIKLFIVGMIQATCIPQVKAAYINQALNVFYYCYMDKTSGWHNTNLTVYFGQGLVAPLNHQHIT